MPGRSRQGGLRMAVEWPEPGVVLVRLAGDVDLAAVPVVTELMRQRLTAASLRVVVVDLSGVAFCSSAGVELLLHAQRRSEMRGIELMVVTGDGPVRRVLELSGVAERFVCPDSAVEALARARG
ncbi:STAS domain-containing protein [Saccharopolyspora cebuensis]|uniref:Anti-sigma factor antagonist n=1 Tax=Saccharopolyspora cebuensis TaxID=418759 RepID=A0ABV4CA92_9PSEU